MHVGTKQCCTCQYLKCVQNCQGTPQYPLQLHHVTSLLHAVTMGLVFVPPARQLCFCLLLNCLNRRQRPVCTVRNLCKHCCQQPTSIDFAKLWFKALAGRQAGWRVCSGQLNREHACQQGFAVLLDPSRDHGENVRLVATCWAVQTTSVCRRTSSRGMPEQPRKLTEAMNFQQQLPYAASSVNSMRGDHTQDGEKRRTLFHGVCSR